MLIHELRAMVDFIDSSKIKSNKQKLIKIIANWKIICDSYGSTLEDAALKRAVSYDLHNVPYKEAIEYIYTILNLYEEVYEKNERK